MKNSSTLSKAFLEILPISWRFFFKEEFIKKAIKQIPSKQLTLCSIAKKVMTDKNNIILILKTNPADIEDFLSKILSPSNELLNKVEIEEKRLDPPKKLYLNSWVQDYFLGIKSNWSFQLKLCTRVAKKLKCDLYDLAATRISKSLQKNLSFTSGSDANIFSSRAVDGMIKDEKDGASCIVEARYLVGVDISLLDLLSSYKITPLKILDENIQDLIKKPGIISTADANKIKITFSKEKYIMDRLNPKGIACLMWISRVRKPESVPELPKELFRLIQGEITQISMK